MPKIDNWFSRIGIALCEYVKSSILKDSEEIFGAVGFFLGGDVLSVCFVHDCVVKDGVYYLLVTT